MVPQNARTTTLWKLDFSFFPTDICLFAFGAKLRSFSYRYVPY
jgi:hypothetical protein